MPVYTTKVACAYPDTFSIQRTDDAFFSRSPEQINKDTYLQVGDAKYKLVVRHTDCDGQQFFYILRDEYTESYGQYYSGPTQFSGDIMAWDLDGSAYVGSSEILTIDQEINIVYEDASTPIVPVVPNVNIDVNNTSDKLDIKINYDGSNLNISIKLRP
jgi:hypothetical protein